MKDYEFISYTQYPDDEYVSASCKVRIAGRFIVTFLEKKMKTGGKFWGPVASGIKKDSEKVWVNGFRDPLTEDDELKAWIDANVRRLLSSTSVNTTMQPTAQAAVGVAADEQLPF